MLDGAALLQYQIDLGHYLVAEFAQIAAFSALVIGIFGTAAGMLIGLRPFTRIPLRIRRLIYAAAFAGSLCILYGIIIEPYRLTVRRIEIESDKIQGKPVRIVHLSDLHVRCRAPRYPTPNRFVFPDYLTRLARSWGRPAREKRRPRSAP